MLLGLLLGLAWLSLGTGCGGRNDATAGIAETTSQAARSRAVEGQGETREEPLAAAGSLTQTLAAPATSAPPAASQVPAHPVRATQSGEVPGKLPGGTSEPVFPPPDVRGPKMNLSGVPVKRPTDGRPVLLTAMGDTIPYAPMGKMIGRSPLEDSPGYQRVFDPESTSVVTGRREVKAHDLGFGEGARSAEELALWVLDALQASDRDQLKALLVTSREFDKILWPEFPESRPITNLDSKDAWFFLERTSLAGINQAMNRLGGQPLEFDRITYVVGYAPYTNFALYHGARIHAHRPNGEPVVLDFADSFADCRGVWKVYTYKD